MIPNRVYVRVRPKSPSGLLIVSLLSLFIFHLLRKSHARDEIFQPITDPNCHCSSFHLELIGPVGGWVYDHEFICPLSRSLVA